MKICVFGAGYVGLITAVGFAELGFEVVAFDLDKEKINSLKKGKATIYEVGLEPKIASNLAAKRLHFTTDNDAIKNCDVYFIAVGTPPNSDGSSDLKYVFSVAKTIAAILKNDAIVMIKSTVPVGTNKKVTSIIQDNLKNKKTKFYVVSNPEFLKEGEALSDFFNPSRIIVGIKNGKVHENLKKLFSPLINKNCPLIEMSPESAELTKYAANAFLATKISFINEIAMISEAYGADIGSIKQGMISDYRIGKFFLNAGIGYGGSCFPKDVSSLVHSASEKKVGVSILKATNSVNLTIKEHFLKKIETRFPTLKNKSLAIWGASFKPETDDIRESPALFIIDKLLKKGANINLHDPIALNNVKAIYGNKINYFNNYLDTIDKVDAICIMTEWAEYHKPDFKKIVKKMKKAVIFDARNIYDPQELQKHAIEYISVGR